MPASPDGLRSIVVVSGLPRSGTSMMMAMLSAGGLELLTDGLRAADLDNPNGYFEFEPVKALEKASDWSWLSAACGKGLKVISFLLKYLPDTFEYKIIFVRRDLGEVLASQRRMLERLEEAADDTSDEDLARAFASHISRVERELAARPNCDLLYLDHRRIIRDPAAVAREVTLFLGRPLHVEKMASVVDGRLYRSRP
jgi:hypothetical protein